MIPSGIFERALRWPLVTLSHAAGSEKWRDEAMYRIREVGEHDDEIADTLTELHHLTFFEIAPVPEFDLGHLWIAYQEDLPTAVSGS